MDKSSGSKSNVEGFSQLLRLLCWCPAYISTHDAMETGVFIWTWLVSAAPQLGALVLAELVDAWLWTIDTKRGLFASEARYCGPAAKLRPHLAPGEPESQPAIDLVEQIIAHRLWLGFLIDRFEVRICLPYLLINLYFLVLPPVYLNIVMVAVYFIFVLILSVSILLRYSYCTENFR